MPKVEALRRPRLRPWGAASPVVTVAALLGVFMAGCGDDAPRLAESGPTAVPTASPAASTSTTTPGPGRGAARTAEGSPRSRAEAQARNIDPDALPRRVRGDRLVIVPPRGEARVWRVSATMGQALCAKAAIVGPGGPPPSCSDPLTTALGLATADGGVQATVTPIRRTAGDPQTELLVWGTALRGVERIRVRSGRHRARAKMSGATITVRVPRAALRRVGDVGVDIPRVFQVRTFAATVPVDAPNPPADVLVTPAKTGAQRSITLRLR